MTTSFQREACHVNDLFLQISLHDFVQIVLVHAGEHGDGNDFHRRIALTRCLGRGAQHFASA